MAFKEDLKRFHSIEALTLSEENPNSSFKSILGIVDRLIDKHCPKKPIPKAKLGTKSKPWITPSLSNSIKFKNPSDLINKRKLQLHLSLPFSLLTATCDSFTFLNGRVISVLEHSTPQILNVTSDHS